jgi:hypothetical protein
VDLAVTGGDGAGRGDQDAGVVWPVGIHGGLGEAACEDPRIVAAGDLAERLGEWTGDRPGGSAKAVVAAAVLEVLGQDDKSGTAGRGLGGELRGAPDVGIDVVGRIELDEGCGEPHGGIVRARRWGARGDADGGV